MLFSFPVCDIMEVVPPYGNVVYNKELRTKWQDILKKKDEHVRFLLPTEVFMQVLDYLF